MRCRTLSILLINCLLIGVLFTACGSVSTTNVGNQEISESVPTMTVSPTLITGATNPPTATPRQEVTVVPTATLQPEATTVPNATPQPEVTVEPTGILQPEPTPAPTATPTPTATPAPIQPLGMVRDWPGIAEIDGLKPYIEIWNKDSMWGNNVTADLSDRQDMFCSLTFSDGTTFRNLPNGYDPEVFIEWGKYPGLNVDILHKYGFTGKGATVAYIDQAIGVSEQYENINLHCVNNSDDNIIAGHGPMVLSLLAGKDIGTAPDVEVYYYIQGNEEYHAKHIECLYQVIETNKSLPKGKKISMVGFSNNIHEQYPDVQEMRDAVAACEAEGIMVWFCGEYETAAFLPLSDKNIPSNLISNPVYVGRSSDKVAVPASGRTGAADYESSGANYIYWGGGAGVSWTMPYVLGLYAIAIEIDPTLTQDELRTLLMDTTYDNNGIRVVNPVGFVAEVLKGVGRTKEAQAMLAEVEARSKYMYAVMDTAAMSEEDLKAVGGYLATITDATVLVVDAAAFSNAKEIYIALQNDAKERGGRTVGVQIFGTADMVPAFQVQYKVQMPDDIDDGGMFLSDLFYGNFDNDAEQIANGYNVLDHFAECWDVELVPDWSVARLPLLKGEFSTFFEKYEKFIFNTGLEQQELVSFSNPNYASEVHIDDTSTFMNRLNDEFDILDVPYRLYGNLLGQYPVNAEVIGGFTAENLALENDKKILEFFIDSHGQWNNIDKTYYEDGETKKGSLINMDTINDVLDSNAYYLDCWTCSNGYAMKDNLTTTALNGNCVGVFSATTVISNNGINCRESVEEMAKSNFYYFFYHYFKALHDGNSRSEAFFIAQKAYAEALITDSKDGIRGDGNYQFNLCNLLAYHNFGVLEPNKASAAFEAEGYIAQAGQSVPKVEQVQTGGGQSTLGSSMVVTEGNPIGEIKKLSWGELDLLQTGSFTVHSLTAQKLDNGYVRFTLDYTTRAGMPYFVFNPPKADLFRMNGVTKTSGNREILIFDIYEEDVTSEITMQFNFEYEDSFCLFFSTFGLR